MNAFSIYLKILVEKSSWQILEFENWKEATKSLILAYNPGNQHEQLQIFQDSRQKRELVAHTPSSAGSKLGRLCRERII